jgi:4a-hydroxytetrahydrobiopterin dehydratase
MNYDTITAEQFDAADGVDDWRYTLGHIETTYRAPSFPAATTLAAAIADAAEAAQHHPDIDIRYPGHVRVVLMTHATGGVTSLDLDLARTISGLAAGAGATADTTVAQAIEVAIDTMNADRIRPFWAAVLGYRNEGDGLVDPRRVGPAVWFQQMDEPRTERSRFHIDVSVPHDQAEARIAAALAAGGRLVNDGFARAFWVLADADGNEACVCTWQDR